MPVTIRLRTPSADGTKTRAVQELTVDYADAQSLPENIVFERRIWQRAGGQNSTNYRPYVPPVGVDIEATGKLLDA